MLRKLSIRNYVIIEQLELLFSDQLTVITGETGAGKSIAIEALSLILGERADASALFDKEKMRGGSYFRIFITGFENFLR